MTYRSFIFVVLVLLVLSGRAFADHGDPQIRTDHPWYPGELAMSTFDRLFATQAESYLRVTGKRVDSDEQKALASWLWRNTHYWHGQAGRRDLWGEGLAGKKDMRLREYWNGYFGYGFGLCGTTHSQWTAEFEHLLGHGSGRGVGASGHNAFEVYLQGGPYGQGRWALLDHDLSTVIYDESGRRLLGLGEIQKDVDRWIKRSFKPEKQNGWLVCGLHPGDGNSYRKYAVAEYLAGYAGPPPMVHLRRGERMRRYFEPGLEDGKTFVFWGRNYNTDGIPGPERSRTWVNQPEQMYRSKSGARHRNGQARFANVEYVYRPKFANGDYREGIVEESNKHVVFEFQTPYIIGATPPNNGAWGIYEKGCRHGLVVQGRVKCDVAVSLNAGRTWSASKTLNNRLDLTDLAKGHSQYWLRFATGAKQLINSNVEIRTVCQANVSVLPRLKDNGTTVTFEASGKAVRSLGPELDLAKTFVTDGAFGQKSVAMTVTPNKPVVEIFAAAHTASGSPPNSDVRYQIECSLDKGKSWQPIVADWKVPRRGDEPGDFWSQSFCYASRDVASPSDKPIQIRFRNDGGKRFLRAEAHLVQQVGKSDPVKVTYNWTDDGGAHRQSHVFTSKGTWKIPTGKNVRTHWVEFLCVTGQDIADDRESQGQIPKFDRMVLSDKYYCDGVAAGDINSDGKTDIVAGPFWYQGPDFKTSHTFYPAVALPPEKSPSNSMLSFVHDFSGDGLADILVLGRVHKHAAKWYENPGNPGEKKSWTGHHAFERVKGESPQLVDLTGDGNLQVICHWENRWGSIRPDSARPRKPWTFTPLGHANEWNQFYHGEGVGDINGDGRLDLIINDGWYEQPKKGEQWIWHPHRFSKARGGAQMFVQDVDGDGDSDVISAVDAHGWGLAWYEHRKTSAGIRFREHLIMHDRSREREFGAAFTQPHALALADIDGDGLKDIIAGKRRWAHGPKGDIEPSAEPVVYWFQLTRSEGSVRYIPQLIDNQSGVGVQILARDVNGDGRVDVVTASKLGTFLFLNRAP